ncbi:N-6 DNA methylase, partial [Candidatus Peregrinibacteria bacterium]|nr:N-6 DNA methylase [Candidatus Peregrinibacteria bacterium]
YTEEETKKDFILPLFRILGWDVENKEEVSAEEKISKKKVDYGFRINGIPKFFLEAKSLRADLDKSEFIQQAINYAWHKGCTWAVLTNFENIVIYNAEWKTNNFALSRFLTFQFYELLERFDELLLLEKEGFAADLLDKEAEKVGKKTKKISVDKQLLADFTEFRRLLSEDIAEQNRKLSQDDLDESVQRILDRLILIRNYEDRGLEEKTLIAGLRESKGSGALLRTIRRIFRYYNAHYDSKIFGGPEPGDKHLCDDLVIDDAVLAEIVERLYVTKDKSLMYDFSAIEADVLGNIYEEYLGHVLEKTKNNVELVEDHTHIKEHGVYYTPIYITDFIVRNTLGEFLKEKSVVNIANVKVLDLACGSGSMLIKAYDLLYEYYLKHGFGSDLPFSVKAKILKSNIFGVDVDKKAVEIAQLNLLLKIAEKGHKLPLLEQNIQNGNSLIDDHAVVGDMAFNWDECFGAVMKEGGFDVIISNPPYVFARGGHFDEKTKQYFYEKFPLASYQLNTYLLFIDRAFRLLKKDGYFGFIIPNTWLTINTFAPLREFLLEETSNLQIINIFDKVFGAANVDNCLLIFKKGKPNNVRLGEFREGKFLIVGDFPASQFKNNNYIINIALAQDNEKSAILVKINEKSKILSNYATASTGLKAYQEGKGRPKQSKLMKEERVFHSSSKKDETFKKYLEGRDVCRYWLGWSGEYLSYGYWLAEPRKSVPFDKKRILVRQIPSSPPHSINAVFTNKQFLNDINSMVIFDFKCDPFYLLAVLNSKLTTFWFINTFDKFQRKIFPQFKVKELATFPIPNASQKEQEKIAKRVKIMLQLNKKLQAISSNTDKYNLIKQEIQELDGEIDKAIYELYGITVSERKKIENDMS